MQAEAILRKHIDPMMEDRDYIRQQLGRFGDLLMRRWKKRSPEKRAALLLQAEPHLPLNKCHQIDRFLENPERQETGTKYRKACLLRYLDAETLKQNPTFLLGLLHYHSHQHPQEWAPSDRYQMSASYASGKLACSFKRGAVIMHGEDYGTLTDWYDYTAHRFDQYGFPERCLSSRHRLRFWVSCAEF